MADVQAKSLPDLLEGKDIHGVARTVGAPKVARP
jgi:hypothetical protein